MNLDIETLLVVWEDKTIIRQENGFKVKFLAIWVL